MVLALTVGDDVWSVGNGEQLHAFFSTISHHLEPSWGERFPALMRELYQGELPARHVETALAELAVARRELTGYPPSYVVWDIDNLHARPPAGVAAEAGVPNLARYFTTNQGRDLFEVLALALLRLRTLPAGVLRIVDTSGILEPA